MRSTAYNEEIVRERNRHRLGPYIDGVDVLDPAFRLSGLDDIDGVDNAMSSCCMPPLPPRGVTILSSLLTIGLIFMTFSLPSRDTVLQS